MEKNFLSKFSSIAGIIMGLIGALALRNTDPYLAILSSFLLLGGLLWLLYQYRTRNYRMIKNGLSAIVRELRQQNFHPDIILSFCRSGGVAGGMLAVNMGVEEVITISRRSIEREEMAIKRREYKVGELAELNSKLLKGKKILVVFMVINTSDTLRVGLDYLAKMGICEDVKVTTLCINTGASENWPSVISPYKLPNVQDFLKRLPWIIEEYHEIDSR